MSVLQPKIDDGTINVISGQTDFETCATADWDNSKAQVRMESLLITGSVGGINEAIEESAKGVNSATCSLVNLVDSFSKVNVQMEENSIVAKNLKKESNNFTSL